MQQAIVIKGRLVNPTTVELDEPVSGILGGVEIILRSIAQDHPDESETVFEFLRRLPPGTRTKDDIDEQIREERASWGDR